MKLVLATNTLRSHSHTTLNSLCQTIDSLAVKMTGDTLIHAGLTDMENESKLFAIIHKHGIVVGLKNLQIKTGDVLIMTKVDDENLELFVPRNNFKATTAKYFGYTPYTIAKNVLLKALPNLEQKMNQQKVL